MSRAMTEGRELGRGKAIRRKSGSGTETTVIHQATFPLKRRIGTSLGRIGETDVSAETQPEGAPATG